jgi:phospholipase D1/2
MPWHDLHALTFGEVARDVARHFIQRWNATKNEKMKNNSAYPFLIPKSYDWTKVPKVFQSENTYTGNVQVLRSVSNWSALIDKTEASIQQAYLSLIANSKHYVYIENQFFVSMINSNDVSNEICRVICDRIIKADRNGKIFAYTLWCHYYLALKEILKIHNILLYWLFCITHIFQFHVDLIHC